MKNIIAISLSAGVVLGTLALVVRATDPVPAQGKGRVLVLENERTLTGAIERVGDQYRIKRLLGETTIPASQVLIVCSSFEEAYQFLKRRANLNDPSERLRLADWCRQHALRDLAREEVQAAAKLRPNDERIRRLLAHLQESRPLAAKSLPAPIHETPALRAEVTAESLGMFASKVQPILTNACVSCHSAGRGGAFQLMRVSGPGLSNRRAVESNLALVLVYVNLKEPATSKFLTKAVSIHGPGMTQAPLKSREATAFRTLEHWVARTADTNPHLREEAHASVGPKVRPAATWGQDRLPATERREDKPASTTPPTAGSTTRAPASPASNDPVDPESFNREFHPKRPITPTPPK